MRKMIKPHKVRRAPYTISLAQYEGGKDKYIPSNEVIDHIAEWEASDFEKQNKQFGGDAISAKAGEFNSILGDYAKAVNQGMLDALFSTYYNMSPATFQQRYLPYFQNFVDRPSSESYNKLDSALRNRYKISKDEHKLGIKRRAESDLKFMNRDEILNRKLKLFKPKIDKKIEDYLSVPTDNTFVNILPYVQYNKGKDSGIHIKKANRGKFTAAAKRAGMGVQAYARKILKAPKGKYSPTLRKRAAFARAASKFKH